MIRNFAVVGPGPATRERLTAALAAAPDMAVYRIGRGADPLPVSATFDPSDQAGCRSLLDWFERGAPAGAVLLVDDWRLCFEQDPELDGVVEWIAAFGPARGVQVVVTARKWDELPGRLRRHLLGEATDFLALHGIEADLGNVWQRRDYSAAIGVDERGWPVSFEMTIDGNGLSGAYLGADRGRHLRAALLGLMVTHSPDDLQFVFVDGAGSGVYGNLEEAPHVAHALGGDAGEHILTRLQVGLEGEINRRQELIHSIAGVRNSWDYREQRDAGADLEPLADLVVCVDSVEAVPEFLTTLTTLIRVGKVVGIRVLISGDSYPEELPIKLNEWPKALPTTDFAEAEQVLPGAFRDGAIPHQIMLPPLHQMGELTVDMIQPGLVGVVDDVFGQRRAGFPLGCAGELRFGVLVGAPGTGKSTALRTLAHALGPDLPEYQLLDGPGEPIAQDKYVVVTARTWAEIPDFMMEKLAFAVEFRLDDPSTSRVDPRKAAALPTHPGIGLLWNNKLEVRFAKS